ncbi:MAG: type II secretion system F family protein, partial [Nitrospinales bacterium]
MTTFAYRATVRGKLQTGEIEAEDLRAAKAALKKQNIRLINSIKKKGAKLSLLQTGQKITSKDIVLFTRQFSTMVSSGLPLMQCLDILGKQADNKSFGKVIYDIKNGIEVGGTLSDSLRKHPKVFDGLFCNLVEAGETGGTLDIILQRLSAYIEKAESLKKKVKSAMIYPSAIVTVAVLV